MKNTIIWDMMLCNLVEVYQRWRGGYVAFILIVEGFLLACSLLFSHEDGSNSFLQTFNKLVLDYKISHLTREYSSKITLSYNFMSLPIEVLPFAR
jgi:hypothetical protein